MVNEQIKRYLPSLAIKEVQFKVIIRYQWLLIKIAHLKKKVLTPNAGKHAEKLNHICIVLGTEDGTAAPEICLAVSYKTDMLSYDPAITLPGLYSREIKTHIHGKALHITMAITVFKSKNWKHTNVIQQVNGSTVTHPCCGQSYGNEKERTTDTYNHLDGSQRSYAEGKCQFQEVTQCTVPCVWYS